MANNVIHHPLRNIVVTIAVAAALLMTSTVCAVGLDPESNEDGFDPAAQSFRINEARRLNQISQQIELNRRMIWENGFNPASPPVDQPIGHESKQVGPNRWIYRPIYREPVVPPAETEIGPELLPTPGSAAAQSFAPINKVPQKLPAPSDAKPSDRIPPRRSKQSAVRGPREF